MGNEGSDEVQSESIKLNSASLIGAYSIGLLGEGSRMVPTFGGLTSGTLVEVKFSSSLTRSLLRPDVTLLADSEGADVIGEGVASSTSKGPSECGWHGEASEPDLLAAR